MNVDLRVALLRKARLITFLTAALVATAALDVLSPSPLAAEDQLQLKIGTIIADPNKYTLPEHASPTTYTLQMVSLEAIVQDTGHRDDFSVTGKKECRQYFQLTDDTGTIAAYFVSFGACEEVARQTGLILSPRDRVVVDGTVDFKFRDGRGGFLGLLLTVTKLCGANGTCMVGGPWEVR